jgi:diguanylate cyclase (GGDEF)-like protein
MHADAELAPHPRPTLTTKRYPPEVLQRLLMLRERDAELVAEIDELRKRVNDLEDLRKHFMALETDYNGLFVLQQVASLINSTLNIDDILSTVLRGAHEALNCQRAIIFDVESGTLHERLHIESDGAVVPIDSAAAIRPGQKLSLMIEGKLDFEIGFARDAEDLVHDPRGQYCRVPIVSRGSVRGILYVDASVTGSISDSQIRMLLDLANQAGIALENARLHGETQRLLEETQRLAGTDPLTGLPNRRAFDDLLQHEIHNSLRHGHPFAYAIFDLDDLKKINDNGGHAAGDVALQNFAHVLKNVSRKGSIVARYAGDEFLVILTQTNRDAAELGVRRIFRNLEKDGIQSSVGIAMFPKDGNDAQSLFVAADEALYRAKSRGKNRYVFSDQGSESA